ncbi:MAG TPA: HGGxSTG domain-containing protein, partial [Gammaproteobacteria bacterium]|nr:HGGxSTG domain-containing protein [Gammaproteobacteria bacterium]
TPKTPRAKRDGQPCRARALSHECCKYHGGLSTGPKTPEGRTCASAKLKQFQSA